jgi:hypothetical protein
MVQTKILFNSTLMVSFALLLLLCLPAVADEAKYRTEIEISEESGCSVLFVTYKNVGEIQMLLPPETPIVLVMDASMKPMLYIGMIVDRPQYTLDEYLKLPPTGELRKKILLSDYGVKRRGKYTVSVNVDYFDPVVEKSYKKGNLVKDFQHVGPCRN